METSNYSAEFMAMRHAVEEVVSLRYMLRCLGLNVDTASAVYGDNLGVIQNVTIWDSLLNKKHVAISYQNVCEAFEVGIIVLIKSALSDYFADCLTQFLPIANHNRLINGLFYGWLALEVCGIPFVFRVCITFGVVYTTPTGWSETRTVSDQEKRQLIPYTEPVRIQQSVCLQVRVQLSIFPHYWYAHSSLVSHQVDI